MSDVDTDTDTETENHDDRGGAPEANGASGLSHRDTSDDRAVPGHASRARAVDEAARVPKLFETDSGVILLADVSSVQCYASPPGAPPAKSSPARGVDSSVCQVVLRSGFSLFVSMAYSRGLIDAVKAHHADGSPVFSAVTSPRSR